MGEEAQLAEVAAALAAHDCALLVQLTRAASTAAIRVAGCKALGLVAKTYDGPGRTICTADTAHDMFEMLASVLGSHTANEDVQAAGLGALNHLCRRVLQAGVFAGEAGAVGAVVAAMRVGTASVRLQKQGCNTLFGLLFKTPGNQRLAADADAVKAVLTVVRTHASRADVQSSAFGALGALVTRDYGGGSAADANRDAAVAHGAIELVAAALVVTDADVSCAACSTLHDLIDEVPENVARAQRCGAFESVLEVMRLHTQDVGVQTNGCAVLTTMALESSLLAAAGGLGAHAAIIHALERFPADCILQEWGCAALAVLLPALPSPDDDARHPGAVACVVNALRAHTGAGVRRHACECLFRLVLPNLPLNREEALRLGAFAALAEVLETHTAHAAVVEECIAALRSLCELMKPRRYGPSLSLPAAEACDAIRCVVAAMRANPAMSDIQRHGVYIVTVCISLHVPDCSAAAAEAGAMDVAVAALRTFVANPELSTYACILLARLSEHWSSFSRMEGSRLPVAPSSAAIAATLTALRTHPGCAIVLQAAAYALARLWDVADGSRTGLQDAVVPLSAALRTHTDAVLMQRWVLEALSHVVVDVSAAVAAVSAGCEGIGAVTELLTRSTAAQDGTVLQNACAVLSNVACCAEAKLSSADAVAPLVHVLANRSHQNLEIAVMACAALLRVIQSSRQHAAEAVRLGAAAAMPAALLADPVGADLLAILETEAQAQAEAQARAQAQAQAQAQACEEAARRADAIAAELIAEEEEAARAAAAPPARKSRKKRGGGGGGAAGGQRAEPASSKTPPVPDAAPDLAAASAAALDELTLNDAGGAADTPSAAAARRRRRAATKAARKRAAGSAAAGASGGEAAARGDEPASDAEDDAAKAEAEEAADAAVSAAAQAAEVPLPPDAAPAATPAAPLPPPPAPAMPAVLKECCVCLSDLPVAELLAIVPCGHHCLCADCWQSLEPPTARRCPICSAPAAMAMRVFF